MAKDSIKGITVKIGADTSDFIKDLKKLDKEINQTQKTAAELQKGLELEFDETRFIEAQKKVQNALTQTENKATSIREKMKQLEAAGNIDTDGYRKLGSELAKAETNALKLKKQLEDLDKIKIDKATEGTKKLSDSLENAAKKTAVLSVAAAGAIAGIVKLGKDAIAMGDEIQTTADKYNISAEAIQRWNYIALQSDVASEQLYKGMTKVRDAVGTALAGKTNSVTDAINELVGNIGKLPTDTEGAFKVVVTALSEVKDSTMQAYYANEIFGEEMATQLIPLFKQGSQGINEFTNEFEQIGYLTNEQVANLAEVDNQMNMLNQKFQNAKTELGIALMPILQTLTDILNEFIIPAIQKLSEWFSNLSEPMQKIITGALLITAGLSPMLAIMSKVTSGVGTLIKMLKSLNLTTTKTYGGFMALVGAFSTIFDLIGNWSKMSTVEKILKTLAVAALTAAAAVTIFHASWSLGTAIGVIAAAVTAGIATISNAGKNIGVETDFRDTDSVYNAANKNYEIPSASSSGGTQNNYTEDHSQYNIEINLTPTGDLNYDAKTLADEVIREIVTKKQASGR